VPILRALAHPKLGEREVLAATLEVDADVAAAHEGILLITDKGFAGRDFEQLLAGYSITLLRPSRADEQARPRRPRRARLRRRRHPSAHPGNGCRNLAQLPDRRPRHPLTDRLMAQPAGNKGRT
jgi:hypothetical protein